MKQYFKNVLFILQGEKMSRDHYISYDHSSQDLDPPAIPESLDRKERVTLDKKMKHPVTPPPPSVNSTEFLISDTLNQHRKHSSGSDNMHDLQRLRKNENFRRKSADFAAMNENGLDDISDSKLNRKSGSVIEDLRRCVLPDAFQKKHDQTYLDNNKENIENVKSGNNKNKVYSKQCDENKNIKFVPEKVALITKNHEESTNSEKGLCNGICVPKYATIATNMSDSLKRIPKIQIKAPSFSGDEISLNNKLNNAKTESSPFQGTDKTIRGKTENTNQDRRIEIEQIKDNIQPQKVTEKVPVETARNKPMIQNIEYDNSPEMQVVINSLSPVLLRRHPTKRSARKVGSDSSESSPETEKKRQLTQQQNTDPHLLVSDKSRNASTEEKNSESLFMDPKMSQTWHGATSANWSQVYGPQMREMIRRLNGENFDDMDAALSDKHFEEGSKTLPSSKSLLDEMHKKFCADQYIHNLTETEMARALVLLRLKSNKPVRMDRLGVSNAKRSASFHIKMGTGTSSSSASSESSPMLPRFSERRHIKTSPRMQYPTKTGRMGRDKTPEPLLLSKDLKQVSMCCLPCVSYKTSTFAQGLEVIKKQRMFSSDKPSSNPNFL